MYHFIFLSVRFTLLLVFIHTLALVSVSDIQSRKIPDRLLVRLFIPAVLRLLIFPGFVLEGVLGFLLTGVFLLLLTLLTGGLGGGDIKLCAVCGLFLGFHAAFYGLALACLPAACYGILSALRTRNGKRTSFAFGPFLAFGFILAALSGL